jgi:hypothetical protein
MCRQRHSAPESERYPIEDTNLCIAASARAQLQRLGGSPPHLRGVIDESREAVTRSCISTDRESPCIFRMGRIHHRHTEIK